MKGVVDTKKFTEESSDKGEPVRKYPVLQKAIFEMAAKTGVSALTRPLELLSKMGKQSMNLMY